MRGFVLPALGLSEWKHEGVVELFSKLADRGYTLLYLTNRPIGKSESTRAYLSSLTENQYRMPEGPICESIMMQVRSLNMRNISLFQFYKLILSWELSKQRYVHIFFDMPLI